MKMRAFLLPLFLLIITSVMTCSAPQWPGFSRRASPTPSSPPTETSIPPSEEPIGSPTVETTSTPPPTATPREPSRIALEPGERSATLEGHLDDLETDRYVLHVQKGQTMDVTVEAPEQVGLAIMGEDTLLLRHPVDEAPSWRGEIPSTQDIFIEITSIEATDYTLILTIPPLSSESSIEVVVPDGGEIWSEGSTHAVLWHAFGVDKVDIAVASGGKPLGHVALGLDATSGQTLWEIPVGLISNFGTARSDVMRVRVSSSGNPQLYDENDSPFTIRCPRIQFAPGTRATALMGTLDPGRGQYRYVVRASAGQRMEMEISPAQIKVDVWGAEDGSTWTIPAGQSELTIAALPANQDYFVTLTNESLDEAGDYVLDIAIR